MVGRRRFGHPRTDDERRTRHRRLYGTNKLPIRGTGFKKRKRKRRGWIKTALGG